MKRKSTYKQDLTNFRRILNKLKEGGLYPGQVAHYEARADELLKRLGSRQFYLVIVRGKPTLEELIELLPEAEVKLLHPDQGKELA